jgi:nucleoside-diphosphate kinase
MEKTLMLIKPDAFVNGKVGQIFSFIVQSIKEIDFIQEKFYDCGDPELHRIIPKHYIEHAGKPFYSRLVGFMTCGPVIACVVGGHNVPISLRALTGDTDPSKATSNTIRGKFGHNGHDPIHENLIHVSDSIISAEREINLWGFNTT